MTQISSLQLFKILSDETRLGIVLLLRDGRAMRVRSLHGTGTVTTQDLPPSGDASNVDCCWIANRASGFTTAYPHIFLPGPLR
jgi:hypothetical protein